MQITSKTAQRQSENCRFLSRFTLSSISAGINALWGPLHGGANQAVIEMLEQIRNDDLMLRNMFRKPKINQILRLMGRDIEFIKVLTQSENNKKTCDEVLEQLGVTDPVLMLRKN